MQDHRKITIADLAARKQERRPIPLLTCYDYATARLMAEAGLDVILVGDTYAEVCLGHASTVSARLDEMLSVTAAVRRGAPNAFLIGDMPFMSYQMLVDEAVRNAGRFLSEAGCDCVKVEVDRRHVDTVAAMSAASIPVMAHLGLRPQSIHQFGAYRGQGRTADDAKELLETAAAMESAGAVALLLEAVASDLAEMITQRAGVVVIGCVSGPHCDGQVLVLHDVLGYETGHTPSSAPRYANLRDVLIAAFRAYGSDVTERKYPAATDGPQMRDGELARLRKQLDG